MQKKYNYQYHEYSRCNHETGLGPGTLCCSAAVLAPGHTSPQATKYKKNYMGLKITVCMCSWGKFWTQKIQKDKKNQLPFLKSLEQKQGVRSKNRVSGAKTGHCTYPLHTTPPKGWAKHLSHPSGPTPGHTPTLTPYKEQAFPPSGSKQARESVVCSCSPLLQQGPQ